MATGLKDAEEQGIANRDIKPENFLYSEKEQCYQIADFGEASEIPPRLVDDVRGSPVYMPPEMRKAYDAGKWEIPPTDVINMDLYSVGVSFYELLTGKSFKLGPSKKDKKRNLVQQRYGKDLIADLKGVDPAKLEKTKSILTKLLITREYKSFNDLFKDIGEQKSTTSDTELIEKHL